MINPEDQIPLDDSEDSDKDDQMSQQDIHSNGLDEERIPADENDQPNTDLLQQASDASEPSFTLNVDKGVAPKAGSNNKKE
ncbi:MAG: hypothetical protein JWP37_1699 [Mucilaginibacter sp.]|nr:hypothetical protein [Mucilaginibacter sp.]